MCGLAPHFSLLHHYISAPTWNGHVPQNSLPLEFQALTSLTLLQGCCDRFLINFIWYHCAARFLHFLDILVIIFILYIINLPEAILMKSVFIWTNAITITKDDKRKEENVRGKMRQQIVFIFYYVLWLN